MASGIIDRSRAYAPTGSSEAGTLGAKVDAVVGGGADGTFGPTVQLAASSRTAAATRVAVLYSHLLLSPAMVCPSQ